MPESTDTPLGGFELICSCDFRVMSESAVLGFAEIKLVVPYGEVQRSAFHLVQELAKYPPLALKLAKKALNLGYDTDVKNARRYALEATALTVSTNDMREGLNAFFEKRKPVFKGN